MNNLSHCPALHLSVHPVAIHDMTTDVYVKKLCTIADSVYPLMSRLKIFIHHNSRSQLNTGLLENFSIRMNTNTYT